MLFRELRSLDVFPDGGGYSVRCEGEGDGWSKVAKMEMEGRSEVVKVERKYNKQRRVSDAF